jgi:hypothetical protein
MEFDVLGINEMQKYENLMASRARGFNFDGKLIRTKAL